jgi:hypothetical protein
LAPLLHSCAQTVLYCRVTVRVCASYMFEALHKLTSSQDYRHCRTSFSTCHCVKVHSHTHKIPISRQKCSRSMPSSSLHTSTSGHLGVCCTSCSLDALLHCHRRNQVHTQATIHSTTSSQSSCCATSCRQTMARLLKEDHRILSMLWKHTLLEAFSRNSLATRSAMHR